MLAGVSKGIAEHFGISEWIPRVLFAITVFMGGLGVALYAAGWVFIRSEDEPNSIADRFFSGASTSRSWLGVGLMVVAGIIILSSFTFLEGEVIWALAFLVVGLLLYLGYIPTAGQSDDEMSPESKEGVQQMTSTTRTSVTATADSPSGDSPAGGSTPPAPPTPTPPELPLARPREKSILGRLTIGVMLLGMGVLALLDNVDSLLIDARPRHYLALAVTILGVGLLVGSIAGRARWLILVGAILVPTLIFSPVFEYEWDSTDFSQRHVLESFDAIETNYAIDVGTLVIDLRDLPWDGQEVVIDASVDAGNLQIFVPEDVGIVGRAMVDVGRVAEPGRSTGGVRDPDLVWNESGELGTVLLEAEVNIGNIEIWR